MASKRKVKRETRFERWLLDVAEALGAEGWRTRLGYDDRHRGDWLWLVMASPTTSPQLAHLELQLERKDAKSAVLTLLADTPDHLALLTRALDGQHRQIRRLDNAKRKFVHRLERMAAHLLATFEQRRGGYPAAALDRLRGLFPAASALIGLEGSHRARKELSEHRELDAEADAPAGDAHLTRQAKRYRPAFAASVPLGEYRRAGRYRPRRGFHFGGDALALTRQLFESAAELEPADYAIANAIEPDRSPDDQQRASALETVVDVADTAADVGGCVVDCDWFDLPDCDVCDVPDCG
jgi:hypothetical protein